MIVKATLAGWRIAEVPTVLSPDGRSRAPHLRSWRDGWRHLRFLLMMSPRWLMLYPGACLIAVGIAAELAILHGPIVIDGVGFDIHTMLYAAGATILGVQLVLFSLLARTVGVLKNLLPMTPVARALSARIHARARNFDRLVARPDRFGARGLLGGKLGACASRGARPGDHDARGHPLGHFDACGRRDRICIVFAGIHRCPRDWRGRFMMLSGLH